MKLFVLFGLWLGYGLLHSLLATSAFKSLIIKHIPIKTHYRLIYNTIATFLLVGLLAYQFSLSASYLWLNTSVEHIIGLGAILASIYLFRLAFRSYDSSEFLGLKYEDEQANQLKQDGVLQYVRHPLYSATLLLIWGAFLLINTDTMLTMCLALTLYLFVGIYWEEKKLIKTYGETYREYRKKVPMLIPPFL